MWDLGNRDIIVLASVISGWAILLNIFGPYLAFTITTFLLVVCGWFITYVVRDDTPFTPHALLALDYLEQAVRELNRFFTSIFRQFFLYITAIVRCIFQIYPKHIFAIMSQRRRSTYQLSSEIRAPATNSSRLSLVDGLSPISRGGFRPIRNSSNLENSLYADDTDTRIFESASSLGQVTSTPLSVWRKEDARNGDIFASENSTNNRNSWKNRQSIVENHTYAGVEESAYSSEGCPWGTSISPKMRSRAAGVKTVQTVAGPLLASTRYNIDPKIYSDVTSPGLASRLTRYASEASAKLTHQSQYGTGQFPRVNLNSSPLPLLCAKTGKSRMPVTVRVAPPENTRYSPPERQQILTDACNVEGKASPSVVQVLREISLKRHASREDVTFELAKKQRTEGLSADNFESFEEITQKRTRDDSSRSEEDASPPNRALRPAKRSKMPSCHDILSSLSSSISVTSGVKRKAIDVSRNGTPDDGKHFKSLDSSHGDDQISPLLSGSITEPNKSSKRRLNEAELKNFESTRPNKRILESKTGSEAHPSAADEATKNARGDSRDNDRRNVPRDTEITGDNDTKISSESVKLIDKLFMKAEPENIDRIITLVEEHESTRPRFSTDDMDEIKKSDIVNMRQTSMKARLRSMFDAISGNATGKINPEVVIQAEEKISSSKPMIVADPGSSATTTSINIAPIATTSLVPIIRTAKRPTTPAKRVTFQFSKNSPSPEANSGETTSETPSGVPDEAIEARNLKNSSLSEKKTSADTFHPSSNTIATFAPLSADSSILASSSNTSKPQDSLAITAQVGKSTNTANDPTGVPANVTSAGQFNSQVFGSTTGSTLFGASSKSISGPISSFPSQTSEANSQSAPSFTFGASKNATTTPSSRSITAVKPPETTTSPAVSSAATNLASSTNISGGMFAFGSPAKSNNGETAKTSALDTAGSSSLLSIGNSEISEKKGFTFGTNQAAAAASSPPQSGLSAIFQVSGVTATSQPNSNSQAAATASAPSGFNFSIQGPSSSMIFGASSTKTSVPSSGFASSTSTAPSFAPGTNSSNSAISAKPGFSFAASPLSSIATTSSSNVSALSYGATSNSATAISPFVGSSMSSAASTNQPNIFGTTPIIASTSATGSSSMMTQSSIFGTPSIASTTTISSTNYFDTSSSTTLAASTNSQPNIFGTAPTTLAASTNSQPNIFGTAPTTSASTNSQPNIFGTVPTTPISTNSQPNIFGTPVTATLTTTTTTTTTSSSGFTSGTMISAFGKTSAQPSAFPATSSASSTFGASPKILETPAFGRATNATSSFVSASGSSGLFGSGGNSEANAPATPLPAFGSGNFGQKSSAPGFGSAGSNFVTSPGNGSASFNLQSNKQFGDASSISVAPPPIYGFSNSSTTTPAFGARSTEPSPIFGPTSTTTTTTSFGAGTTVSPAFGSIGSAATTFGTSNSGAAATAGNSNTGSSTFAASNSTFGATSSAPPPFPASIAATSSAFGNSTTNTGFGASANNNNPPPPNFSAATSGFANFGATPNAASPFGGTSGTSNDNTGFAGNGSNNNAGASFAFGAAQPNVHQQPQQNPVFSFGGGTTSSVNSATSGSAPFQFGTGAPQTGGFNFTGAPATPAMNFTKDSAAGGTFGLPTPGTSSFGAPPQTTGGMFSIGTGSTAPRSRPSRRRQR